MRNCTRNLCKDRSTYWLVDNILGLLTGLSTRYWVYLLACRKDTGSTYRLVNKILGLLACLQDTGSTYWLVDKILDLLTGLSTRYWVYLLAGQQDTGSTYWLVNNILGLLTGLSTRYWVYLLACQQDTGSTYWLVNKTLSYTQKDILIMLYNTLLSHGGTDRMFIWSFKTV
jgi:ABC-type enterobactin transport system permease subunit